VAVHLGEYLFCGVKRGIRSRDTTINGGLQQNLLNLFAGNSIVGGGAQMHTQLVTAIERDHHGDSNEDARFARQARARPNLSPGVTRDEVLKVGVEAVFVGLRSIDVRITQDGAPDFHSLFVPLPFIHRNGSFMPGETARRVG
jgi:hypothetical protein